MGGNILPMEIKIKRPAGQNLDVMTFKYLKTLVFDIFFKKKLQHYLMFLILKSITSDN